MIRIIENKSSSYAPRTYANAQAALITAAFAVDYYTAGEKLTMKAAGTRFIKLPLEVEKLRSDPESQAEMLLKRVISMRVRKNELTINIAGNGIYTLARHGWSQAMINDHITTVLAIVHEQFGIKHIYCGGQTGADIAGAVAARRLGIDATVHMPRGLKQRTETGEDIQVEPKALAREIDMMAIDVQFGVKQKRAQMRP